MNSPRYNEQFDIKIIRFDGLNLFQYHVYLSIARIN